MHPSLVVSGRGDELHSDGGQKSGTGQHQLSLRWALFGLPLQAACCEALGEIRGSKLNLPVPEPVSVFPLVDGGRRGEWGGEAGREGSRCSLKGTFQLACPPCDLPGGHTMLPHANNPWDRLRLCRARGHTRRTRSQAVLEKAGLSGPGWRARGRVCVYVGMRKHWGRWDGWSQLPITGLAKGYLLRPIGKQGQKTGQAGFLFGEKNQNQIIRSHQLIVHIFLL